MPLPNPVMNQPQLLRCQWNTLVDIIRRPLRSSSSLFESASSLLPLVSDHIQTIILFTYADYKTVFVPISVFAAVSAPAYSIRNFLHGASWIWWHILQCNVSNQLNSVDEDKINRPWRPIPSGRITQEGAAPLRAALFLLCIAMSAWYGWDVAMISLVLAATMYLYDELGLSRHWLGRTICNVPGYATFEIGAMKIMAKDTTLGSTAVFATTVSILIKITTNQMEDFADVAGDKAVGRSTLPILYPRFAKVYSGAAAVAWSLYLGYAWEINPAMHILLVLLGLCLARRTLRGEGDKYNYITRRYYNGWLLVTHLLPIAAICRNIRSA